MGRYTLPFPSLLANLLRLFSELRVMPLLPHAVLVYIGLLAHVWVCGVHARAGRLKIHSPSVPVLCRGVVHILWSRRSHIFSPAVPILRDDCFAQYVPSAGPQMLVYGPEFSQAPAGSA